MQMIRPVQAYIGKSEFEVRERVIAYIPEGDRHESVLLLVPLTPSKLIHKQLPTCRTG